MAKRIKKYKDDFFEQAFKIRSSIIDECLSFKPTPLSLFSIHVVMGRYNEVRSFLVIGRNRDEAINEIVRLDSEVRKMKESINQNYFKQHFMIYERP